LFTVIFKVRILKYPRLPKKKKKKGMLTIKVGCPWSDEKQKRCLFLLRMLKAMIIAIAALLK